MFLHVKDSLTFESESIDVMPPRNMTMQLLYSALAESAGENRLVEGTSDCIELLRRNPNKVLVCILPVNEFGMNVNLAIQHTLIESICLEYTIPIVKIDKIQIQQLLMNSVLEAPSPTKASQFVSDLDCCFIESQGEDLTESGKKLMNLLHYIQEDNVNELYADFPK